MDYMAGIATHTEISSPITGFQDIRTNKQTDVKINKQAQRITINDLQFM
jgi:hypothetical protein